MRTADFDFTLPDELVAQYPADSRGESRMLILDRHTGEIEIGMFSDIVNYINPGDCTVFNNTRVMNARMYGVKEETGAKIEILMVSQTDEDRSIWNCLVKPGKRVKPNTVIRLLDKNGERGDDLVQALEHNEDGTFRLKFESDIWDLQERYGHVPLPPYIKRGDETSDFERYQTIFACQPGAVAAPTAGLHFTPAILDSIKAKGVNTTEVTLHVGPGTFKPVSVDDVTNHHMHTEEYFLTDDSADLINNTHKQGNKVLSVGTTTVRVLESCADQPKHVAAGHGLTDIFIYPPYQPKAVDMLLTNFHLPKSTLLMLVSAFASRDFIMNAYQRAIDEKFMFYSYGDCMLIK